MAIKQLSDGNPDGTSLGQSASDKISFFGETPVVQQVISTVTDSSGGTTDFVIAAVGATNSGDVSAVINNNFSDLASAVGQIRTALQNIGIVA